MAKKKESGGWSGMKTPMGGQPRKGDTGPTLKNIPVGSGPNDPLKLVP